MPIAPPPFIRQVNATLLFSGGLLPPMSSLLAQPTGERMADKSAKRVVHHLIDLLQVGSRLGSGWGLGGVWVGSGWGLGWV